MNLIKQVFADVDAHAILRIPVRGAGDDPWAWEPEVRGFYSVKSAYRCLYDERYHQGANDIASTSGDLTWSHIWRLCFPPKVRVFWWRVVNGFLPAREILHKRHIERVPNCDLCGADVESIKHVVVDCTAARLFWEQTRALTGAKLPRLHPETWARDLIDPSCCSEQNAAIFLCGMWSLWMSRNKRRHDEPSIPMKKAVDWAKDTAFGLWSLSHLIKEKGQIRVPHYWRGPPPGWIKCNVDASFVPEERRGATGVVLRDQDGQVCGGRARWYDHCLSALSTEAIACRDGIQFAIDRRVQRLQLETDCQVMINL